MPSVLHGVRVIESTTMITGSLAGMMLGDLGASIVKVENPKGGDPFRYFRGDDYSPHFRAYNRNKESLALDLRAPQGREIYLKLVEEGDLKWFRSVTDETPDVYRGFCGECGSSLFWDPRGEERIAVAAGSLDQPTGLKSLGHSWTTQKADYYEIDDDLPKYFEKWGKK